MYITGEESVVVESQTLISPSLPFACLPPQGLESPVTPVYADPQPCRWNHTCLSRSAFTCSLAQAHAEPSCLSHPLVSHTRPNTPFLSSLPRRTEDNISRISPPVHCRTRSHLRSVTGVSCFILFSFLPKLTRRPGRRHASIQFDS